MGGAPRAEAPQLNRVAVAGPTVEPPDRARVPDVDRAQAELAVPLLGPVPALLEELGLDWLASLFTGELELPEIFGDFFADLFVDTVPPAAAGPVPSPAPGLAPGLAPGRTGSADEPGQRTFDVPPAADAEPAGHVAVEPDGGAPVKQADARRPAGPGGPVPSTAAEIRARTEAATAALPYPQAPRPAQAGARIDAVAETIAERSETDVAAHRRLPASIVAIRPSHRRPPKPDPGPIPEQMAVVKTKTGRTLTPAVLPPVTRSPRGTMPDVTRPVLTDLELRAIGLGDKAILAMAWGTDDASLAERDKLLTIHDSLGRATAVAPQDPLATVQAAPVPTSAPVQDEPVAGAALTREQQAQFALVVADLRADPAQHANSLIKSVRQTHSHFPGGVLDRERFASGPLTAGLLPEATAEIAAEATALADALALTPAQLDLAVQLRKEQVERMRADAAGVCRVSADEANRTAVQGDSRRRAEARRTAAGVETAAAADRTRVRPPSRVQQRIEQAMADLRDPVASELARLDEQLRQRERALADAVRTQVSAIRLAQTADEIALQPAEGTTRGTTEDRMAAAGVRRWADASVAALSFGDTSAQATLLAAARAETETFKSELRSTAADALSAVRAWGSQHVKANDAWWTELDASLGRWYGTALTSAAVWENQRGQASRIALAQDLESIKRIQAIQEAGAKDAASAYITRLDGEARAVVGALAGGDLAAAFSEGLRERVRSRHQPAWEAALECEVMNLPIKENWDALDRVLHEVQPGWNIDGVVDKIHTAVTRYRGHDEESIFEALSGLSPLAARLLPWRYEYRIEQSLDDALRGYGHVGHLSTDEMKTANQMLDRNRIQGAVGAIHSALMGPGSEMGAVKRILRALTPAERTEVVAQYLARYEVSLEAELKDQWSVSTLEAAETMSITRSDLTGAAATALQRTVVTIHTGGPGRYGGGGGDDQGRQAVISRKAAAEVYAQIRSDVEAEAAGKSWTSNQVEAEITLRSHELGVRFDQQAADQWWVKNKAPGTTATEAAFAMASPAGQDLLHGLATNDLVKIDVAKIRLEDEGLWASDAAINAVFRDQASRSLADVQRDMGPILQARTDARLRKEEAGFANAEERVNRRMELERENAAQLGRLADTRTRTRMGELGGLYQEQAGRSLTDMVNDNMSFTSREEALARVAQRGVLEPYQKLQFAIEGLGTDMPMLRSTLATMSLPELVKADARWRAEHHGESLIEAIKDDTSGREQTDLVDMATYGVPQTAEQVVEAAERKLERDQKAATTAGAAFTRKESQHAAHEVALLRSRLTDMRRSGHDSDAQWRASTSFDIAVERADTAIENQRQALDSITDMLANAAAIITAIVVGAVLAPFTAGGSAVVAAAIISSLAATAVSIAVKQMMKGSYYGRGELATDLAIGAVDALVSALTAGLGHGLLGRVAGTGTATVRSLTFARALSRLGPIGRAAARSEGVIARGASRFAFLEGMDQSKNFAVRMIGRGTAQLIEQGVQAVPSSFAGALLDESVIYDPRGPALLLENTISGTLHSTAMGLGLAAAHHVGAMGFHGGLHGTKLLVDAIRVMAPAEVRMPTGDVLAHVGSPADRLREFRAWQETNPGGTAKEFIAERRANIIEAWQLGDAERARVREARTELLSVLEPAQRGRYADVPIRSVGDAEFARMTGHTDGDARLVVREGQAVLVVREGAPPGAVAATFPEVQQRVFPGTFGMTVEAALPRSLRDTPIRIDTSLPRDEIRVRPVPATGKITGVEVIVGPGVHPIDVGLHAGEVARIRRWTGLLGDARHAAADLMRRVGLRPVTPEDRVRFEAAGEVRKLGPIIEERIRRMAGTGDPVAAMSERLRILRLMAQHERYRRVLAGEIEAEPKGYVAQEGEPPASTSPPAKPTVTDAAEALARLGEQGPLAEQRLERAREMFILAAKPLLPFGRQLELAHERFADTITDQELPGVPRPEDYVHSGERAELRSALQQVLDLPVKSAGDRQRQLLAQQTMSALNVYEHKMREIQTKLAGEQTEAIAAERALEHHESDVARWMEVITGSPKLAAELTTDGMLMGVPLSTLLPKPKVPKGYVPKVLEGSKNKMLAHILGLHAEAHMANRIADDMPEPHVVIDFGDVVGTTGYDAFSVDPHGMPYLWDSKYRSSGVEHFESETFIEPSRIQKAVDQAIAALTKKPGRLTQQQVDIALAHLAKGEFVAYTVTTKDATNFHSAVRADFQNKVNVGGSVDVPVPWNH